MYPTGSYNVYHLGPIESICSIPMVQRNVIINETNQNFTVGHLLTYYCNRSSSGFVATNTATSVCTERGKWIPNPVEYKCESLPNSRGKH